jgi:hypothetical protein
VGPNPQPRAEPWWHRLWQQYLGWRERQAGPGPLSSVDDIPVPPGHIAVVSEEYGDVMDPQSRPEGQPGETSQYPQPFRPGRADGGSMESGPGDAGGGSQGGGGGSQDGGSGSQNG